jgi:8-oxo-dGTP pyrophosphatase MutT (NUDIX family)
MEAAVDFEEYSFIRSTQYYGRCHDVTLYIFKGNKVIVNAKHSYPEGLYRAPSGGLKPAETFEEGALREAYEETGTKIELDRYILQINVSFTCGKKSIPWRTHVMTANYKSGKIRPVDIGEIREAKLAELSEFDEYKKIIEFLDSGGLAYRARLHDEVVKLL